MKIFIADRHTDRWDPAWDEALLADSAPRPDILPLTLGADSALVRPGFPCFLPDFASEGWELRLAPVFRIGRLGKWIDTRFAPRYLDSVTLAAILRPAPAEPHAACPAFLPVFDGAITPGSFIPCPLEGEAIISYGPRGEEPSTLAVSLSDLRTAETLAIISRSVTLKSGDLLVPAMLPATFPARIGTDIEATLAPAGTPLPAAPMLRARVK